MNWLKNWEEMVKEVMEMIENGVYGGDVVLWCSDMILRRWVFREEEWNEIYRYVCKKDEGGVSDDWEVYWSIWFELEEWERDWYY